MEALLSKFTLLIIIVAMSVLASAGLAQTDNVAGNETMFKYSIPTAAEKFLMLDAKTGEEKGSIVRKDSLPTTLNSRKISVAVN